MITKYTVSTAQGHQIILGEGKPKTGWLGLEALRLEAGERWSSLVEEEEFVFIPLSGRLSISLDNGAKVEWKGVGGRADIFGGSPWAVYAPRRCKVTVVAETKLELALAKAPCDKDLSPTIVKPEEVKVVSAGIANWRRDVRLVIAPGSAISQRLIVGETLNPPGNWSGIPPHKHDEISGKENYLEEFYWYKVKPSNGYGIQLGYKDGVEESYYIHNDDVFVMQNGYHPTVAAPGITLGYLWVLSGDDKAYNISTDPIFDWVSSAESILREINR